MTWIVRTFFSSIGKKVILALTGLALCGFLITHLLGVLFTFAGQEILDGYATLLEENILLIPAEIFLCSLFLIHIFLAIRVTLENRKSRPRGYGVRNDHGVKTGASSTMIYTGFAAMMFLFAHLAYLKFSARIDDSLYLLMLKTFRESLIPVTIHVIAVFLLGYHLSHGIQSAIRTLGLNHPRFNFFVRLVGYGFGCFVAVGFSSVPVYLHFFQGGAQ